jgi:uncharacterized protein YkwD
MAAKFESLGSVPSRHRALARVSLAVLAFTIVTTVSLQEATNAGPERTVQAPTPILPLNVGAGVGTDAAVLISFAEPMDAASVEAGLQLYPDQPYRLTWSDDGRSVALSAERLWRTDERYVVVVDGKASRADGTALGNPLRYSFTTQTAPFVADFQVRFAGSDLHLEDVASAVLAEEPAMEEAAGDAEAEAPAPQSAPEGEVSASSVITIAFSAPMDRADVEPRFAITPDVDGELRWEGDALVFEPSERLVAGMRYTVSLTRPHDATGNVLGGTSSFSFVVRPGAQLVRVRPHLGEKDVDPAAVEMWFSQPMDAEATNGAFAVVDTVTGEAVAGRVAWNDGGSQLAFTPDEPFAAGRTFEVRLVEGARDADGNPVTKTWSFTTRAEAVAAAPARGEEPARVAPPAPVVVPAPAPSADVAIYALNQVNAARAAYGFAPVTLDAAISAAAQAHAGDQAANGYFSHTSLDGRTREDRLRAAGVGFSWSGENQCYLVGRSIQGTLDWCHAQFMAEPYPGHFNHIANILNPNARRMGVGFGQAGGRVVITWNFTD